MSGLVDGYDLIVLDLDGVVYLGKEPVTGAVEAIRRLRTEGRPVAYATNNAARTPDEVAAHITELGVPAEAGEVLTSPQAAARLLAERFGAGTRVLVVGTAALRTEVELVGLTPVESADDDPAAVVQGYGPDVGWPQLAEACVAIRGGALWVATNTDRTLPSPRGPLPGNGSLVAALATALDRRPDAAVGKPEPDLFLQAAKRVGASRPLVVGDRLDTDIEGANRAGMDSLLVLTGVSGAAELLACPAASRPTYVAETLAGLFDSDPTARLGDAADQPHGWRATRDGDTVTLDGDGAPVDALRALCAAAWNGDAPTSVTAASPSARDALAKLSLADS